MIYEVIVRDKDKTPCRWWPKVPWLQRDSFSFASGVNVLFGPNGSRKSTLLVALARLFHCEQGGVRKVTRKSVSDLTLPRADFADDFADGLDVRHDGRVAGFFDPSRSVGLVGGGFDGDFFEEGVVRCMVKGSSGQTALSGLGRVATALKTVTRPLKIDGDGRVNDLWQRRIDRVKAFLAPNQPMGQPTMLLDEPDRSLSIPNRVEFWRQTCATPHVQVIVATHDPLVLRLPPERVTIMETEPGYVETCRAALASVDEPAFGRPGGSK